MSWKRVLSGRARPRHLSSMAFKQTFSAKLNTFKRVFRKPGVIPVGWLKGGYSNLS